MWHKTDTATLAKPWCDILIFNKAIANFEILYKVFGNIQENNNLDLVKKIKT
jgi:hypothetical protein